jgi:hypothetical protein
MPIPVERSCLYPYLEKGIDPFLLTQLEVLDNNEAEACWEHFFDGKARHLFDLPPDTWVSAREWKVIGNWIEGFTNEEVTLDMRQAIRNSTKWTDNEKLWLVENRTHIISLTLPVFFELWETLLAVFDDAPILAAFQRNSANAVRFVPLGQILFCDECQCPPGMAP